MLCPLALLFFILLVLPGTARVTPLVLLLPLAILPRELIFLPIALQVFRFLIRTVLVRHFLASCS